MTDEYDVIVVGSGPVGENVADAYAEHARMVVDERRKVLLGLTLAPPTPTLSTAQSSFGAKSD
ncbi:hypothetical protein [Kribbella sp. NPDC051770]|uniref:hypothetical protein n=1 Tax=Kribbella sp. NPDC051770 TaxID=3155413 RepID=UPI003425A090